MDEHDRDELLELFAPQPGASLPPDVMAELQSMLRLHSISPQELFYKWESYSIKMGGETQLDIKTARAFKTDLLDSLVRENRSKTHGRSTDKRGGVASTPRGMVKTGGDVYGMLDNLVPSTPSLRGTIASDGGSLKRKAGFDTPGVTKSNNPEAASSPLQPPNTNTISSSQLDKEHATSTSFASRPNAGQVIETLNPHLAIPDPPLAPSAEPRIKLTANTDLKKFSYRPMAMHLSEASEVLDDRIDEFTGIVQEHYQLPDSAFGSAANQSTNEIIAVGRIASDSLDGRLNAASLVLETSRRVGAGLRVPLRVEDIPTFEFFPGQIVALRGVNASGEYFSVTEILEIPLLPVPASTPGMLETHLQRVQGGPDAMDTDDDNTIRPLTVFVAAGPYTPDDNLDFEALHELCHEAATSSIDVLLLIGPFLDIEHPLLASGDFDLPSDVDPDSASMTTVFRHLISTPLRRLTELNPSITILMIPSVRDVISKHVSWPQEPLSRKELGLPKQAKLISNPVTVSLNEITVGCLAQDILAELRQSETFGSKPKTTNMLARLSRHLILQRHFFPLFPPAERRRLNFSNTTATKKADGTMEDQGEMDAHGMGAMLDPSYLKLGEWLNVRPDVLVTPSILPSFAKVVESVLVINPGMLSKRRAPGTYARLTLHPLKMDHDTSKKDEEEEDEEMLPHKVFERARVDIVRI
ncbi:MAG: mRNA cap guanine-N7 methyltransferase [Watsoniomyces obsoletus]|nr:MAG: mRNA cap guanine-N7 methyltransferase [Watsoniomyces obsoletus]